MVRGKNITQEDLKKAINKNGTLTGDMEEKLNIWAEYLEKLLEGNNTQDPTENTRDNDSYNVTDEQVRGSTRTYRRRSEANHKIYEE
ncbi:hypothetical protein ILUMI_11305 [Ignelater luminosus]|uniref:Uncharacterized protein n=1 Tax=Ignelater luminosus TaxID=2038154 RepID=A0A8K0GCU3_IGNLU|nr:hypothetical protein ILUMI_11305 [Ignelater luminosus]